MRIAIMVSIALILSACDKIAEITTPADQKFCEASIKRSLKAPSTYNRISITTGDSQPMTHDEITKEAGIPKPVNDIDRQIASLSREIDTGHKLQLRTMIVEYDAENAFGTPMRELAACIFKVRDGKLMPETEMKDRTSDAKMADTVSMLESLGRDTSRLKKLVKEKPEYTCCI